MDGTVRWSREFGPEYAPPREILELVGVELEDHSWHNDVCPVFGVRDPETDELRLVVWSDAVLPEDREHETRRFAAVLYGPDGATGGDVLELLETDDVRTAVAEYRRLREILSRRRALSTCHAHGKILGSEEHPLAACCTHGAECRGE